MSICSKAESDFRQRKKYIFKQRIEFLRAGLTTNGTRRKRKFKICRTINHITEDLILKRQNSES